MWWQQPLGASAGQAIGANVRGGRMRMPSEPVQLSIVGHRRPALDGGRFIHTLQRLLGQRLT
jgi:hypothetical protein